MPRASAAPAPLHAPSIGVPLGFILFGLLCLAGVAVMLVAKPTILATYHYNQFVVAATHLAVLGWIASVIIGALYQLVPVALETKLYSERLAWAHLLTHVVGAAGMVWSFWHWNLKHVGHWGSLFAFGIVLCLLNIGRTVLRSRRWNPTSIGILSALGWLGLTVLAGLMIATAKCSYESLETLPADGALAITLRGLEAVAGFMGRFDPMAMMHAHAHLGVLGGFVLLLVTLSFKLLPMFLLSEVRSPRRVGWIIGLLNGGLLGLALSMAQRSAWKLFFAAVLLAALACYALELRAVLRSRKRRQLDTPIRIFLTGLLFLAPLALLAPVLSWKGLPLTPFTGQLENLYGFLALFGLLSTAILGMLFKILPFLVWYGTYSPHLGRARVPALADMYSDRLLQLAAALHLLSLATLSTGILLANPVMVRWGGVGLCMGLALFLVNAARVLSHRPWPRIVPLTMATGGAR